jgi:catechol 2,3-dioxygenase-like lactoylglutathione lyase family enzyme
MALKDSRIVPVLAVDDIDRAIGFYRDKLGLEVRRAQEDPTSAFVHVGEDRFLLYTSTFKRGETTVASFIVDDVEATVRELRDRGVTFEEYDLPELKTEDGVAQTGDFKSAWIKDSEGNTIAFSESSSATMEKAA